MSPYRTPAEIPRSKPVLTYWQRMWRRNRRHWLFSTLLGFHLGVFHLPTLAVVGALLLARPICDLCCYLSTRAYRAHRRRKRARDRWVLQHARACVLVDLHVHGSHASGDCDCNHL